MTISKKIVEAILRDLQLNVIFRNKMLLNEEKLNLEILLKNEKLSQVLVHTMLENYLDYTLEYPHPINTLAQVMNPIKIVGVYGAYLVVEDYEQITSKFTFFGNKVKAIQYANKAYHSFLLKTNLLSKGKGLKPYRN